LLNPSLLGTSAISDLADTLPLQERQNIHSVRRNDNGGLPVTHFLLVSFYSACHVSLDTQTSSKSLFATVSMMLAGLKTVQMGEISTTSYPGRHSLPFLIRLLTDGTNRNLNISRSYHFIQQK
jgi:hypothetical protein